MVKISESDLFLYVGGESDSWAKGATYTMVNENNISIALMDLMGDRLKEEEIVEGMQAEEEEDVLDEPEYDEHVWLSLTNAKVFVNAIAEALMELDPENADYYRENLEAYQQELDELDAKYRETVENAEKDTLVFGDRFPFLYLADDYGIKYYAAFVGCSAETEASFETIVFLANKLDELGLRYIMMTDGGDGDLTQAIIYNTQTREYSVGVLDSMQSTMPEDLVRTTSYLAIMEENRIVLEEVLN
jgi:zinc transport system substrate-binding protein